MDTMDRAATEQKILDACRKLFEKGGEKALTMRAIAEECEISSTILYRHFETKESLMLELQQLGVYSTDKFIIEQLCQQFGCKRDDLLRTADAIRAQCEELLAIVRSLRESEDKNLAVGADGR